ncbi:MAG: BBP7 family outer membrane beta-barrel protein [Planctomycetia bacterium]|nr:BBP7 family outer membrane beta-barrel protein [Planctomycetia bacterium]
MRGLPVCLFVGTLALFGGKAYAEDAPVPPPPPPELAPQAPVAVPPAPPAPPPAPTVEERRRVIDQAPATVTPAPTYRPYQPAPQYYYAPAPAPAPLTQINSCEPCGPQPCFQKRDACGCRLDSCGNRYGCWDITLEGALASISSPDGILGETLFVPGNQLDWDSVDYDGAFGGRLSISYHFECESRVELRGTYYGNPDASTRDAGFFAARPGDDGLGDISRAVNASFNSEAELFSVEFNWWTELRCSGHWRWDAGVGVRYISFDEDAHVDFVTTGPGAFPVDNGFVHAEVQNDFIGAQAMLTAHADISDCMEFYGSLKAMFGTVDRQIDVTDVDIFAGGSHSASVDDDEFVFGLDFEMGMKWQLSRCLGIGVSYNLLFLDNVQRAEDSFDFSQSNSGAVQARQATDQLVTHTLFFGVTFNF